MKEQLISSLLTAVSLLVWVYDIITLPIYAIIQWPWQRLSRANTVWARPVADEVCRYQQVAPPTLLKRTMRQLKLDTVAKIVRHAVKEHGGKSCFGVREILSEQNEIQPNGKVFKKFELGEYRWVSYVEFGERADWFGRALCEIGLQPRQRLAILAETRAEWLVAAVGCFFQNITVVTLYATLSESAIVHGINETEVTHLLTSHDLLDKVKRVLLQCPRVTHVVYMEDQLQDTDCSGVPGAIQLIPFSQMLKTGENSTVGSSPSTSSDIAVIMYTSGSTGTPKGVLLSHRNMVLTMTGFALTARMNSDDIYLAFLPLAHVLELMAEMCWIMFGVPIGYSSALTLMDTSSKVKRGCRGDAIVLRPTLMAAVPLILDRIVQGLEVKMESSGALMTAVFRWAVRYRNAWRRRGFDTPILHQLLFSRIAALLGGRIKTVACGGAPLSDNTHEMIRSCMGVNVLQGYGLTETSASATLMNEHDISVGRVGTLMCDGEIRLVDWEEGNYRVTDTPRPRGEILVGGDNVSIGYYKLPEKTAESFLEEGGVRWFRTGDIGEMYPNGTLRIIDRKKDLVKLQSGEYVSLGRVEAVLKTSPLVDNMFVYAEPSRSHVVAVVVPVLAQLQQLARLTCAADQADAGLDQLCRDTELAGQVQKRLAVVAKNGCLDKWEMPMKVGLTSKSWTPDNNLVTAAFKLKRKELSTFYQEELRRLYN